MTEHLTTEELAAELCSHAPSKKACRLAAERLRIQDKAIAMNGVIIADKERLLCNTESCLRDANSAIVALCIDIYQGIDPIAPEARKKPNSSWDRAINLIPEPLPWHAHEAK